MLVCREVAFLQTQSDEQQHQHTDKHVEAVKTGEHVEGRAIHPGAEFQIHFRPGMGVFVALHKQEGHAQEHGQPHELDGFRTVAMLQSMVRHGQGHARGQQQTGVDGGQPERRHGLEGLDNAGW